MGTSDEREFLERALRQAPDLICALDAEGYFRYVGAASQPMLGYAGAELVGQHFTHIICPDDRAAALGKYPHTYARARPASFETRCQSRAGHEVVVEWSASRPPAEALLLCIGRDVTARRRAARRERMQAALYRTVAKHGFDMVALTNADGAYTYLGRTTQKVLGYSPAQLLGRSAFDFLHPDDQAEARAAWAQLGAQAVVAMPDHRFRAANGEWRWLSTFVSNQLLNPAIRAYTMSSCDITKRKHSGFELAESEQRFRLLFENNPALAVFQDLEGRILDINPAFAAFLNVPKAELLHRQLQDFLPAKVCTLFRDNFLKAIAGHKVHFEADLDGESGAPQILKVTKIPLVVEGRITGVHVAAEDITEIATAHRLIARQAEQLTTTLESITDAFLSLDRDWNLTYLNREAERLINISRQQGLGKNIWEFFPEEAAGTYRRHYELALETGKTVHFQAFFARGKRWLELKAYPHAEGLSIYFSDVTERVAAEQRLKLLALVAQGTDNGVIITDALGRTEWVNEGFTKHTGYVLAELLGRTPGAVLQGPETDPVTVRHIRERLKRQTPFSATILNYRKSGKKVWFSMDITPIRDEAGKLTQFVAIQQNITYRKEVEASQASMTQDLYRHNRDLQQFTYVISHNLRAPLANALGLATVLTKVDKSSDVFGTTLANLRQSMVQADAVLKDLNQVLSIRDKKDVLELEPLVLEDVCNQAIQDLEEPLRQCGGQVDLDIEANLVTRGNRAYLYSIFYNLLSNSIKYRSDERRLQVDIACYRGEHGGPSISFTDNGSGFDMYKAGSDIFQLYKRFHTNQRGRGIGLFLVKTHVEAMGGKIEVTSGVNFGTRFLIHLNQR